MQGFCFAAVVGPRKSDVRHWQGEDLLGNGLAWRGDETDQCRCDLQGICYVTQNSAKEKGETA